VKTLRCPEGKDTGDACLSDSQVMAAATIRTRFEFPYPLANGVTSYVGVHTFVSEGDSDCAGFANRTVVIVTVVDVKPRQQTIVTVSGEALAKDISATGRVAVYGIFFDFDKAIVKPDSKPQLDEIAKLLKSDPQLRVLIVGHTDDKGGLEYNQALSEQRAKAVVEALVKTYGVAANRLTPMGAGMASPVASNNTEEGQAKNRRVEIVKM
jgi:outer membrane protein OmpA-like peptidoglycan-associated protein